MQIGAFFYYICKPNLRIMKKIYTLVLLLSISVLFSQSVVITNVVDGTLGADGCSSTSGTSSPKIIELYVSGTVNLTNYRLQTESNGAANATAISWSQGCELATLGTVTNSFIYIVSSGNATFTEMFPSKPIAPITDNLPTGNGNDAFRIALYDAPPTSGGALVSVIDQYGDPLQITASSDYSAPWAYQDSYAKRNNGILANGGTFITSSFTYGGNGLYNAPNNTCNFLANSIGIGSYTLGINQNSIAGLRVYPNPVSNGTLFIDTDSIASKNITVYDVLGKQVLKTTTSSNFISVASLKTGVYIIKITEEGNTATQKLVIK